MTFKDIDNAYNQGLLSDDEADRLRIRLIDTNDEIQNQEFKCGEQRQETDDDWYYAKQLREENDWNCADADVEDVDFSEVEV